jgi:hypothetical protein
MNRAEWQQLALQREIDAKALLAAGCWAGAYYLAGYAVECGRKSCVIVYLVNSPEVVFLERRFSEKCWTHELEHLVDLAGLATARAQDVAVNQELANNWTALAD